MHSVSGYKLRIRSVSSPVSKKVCQLEAKRKRSQAFRDNLLAGCPSKLARFRAKESNRLREYRSLLTPEKKKCQAEKGKVRMQRYRKRKAEKLAEQSPGILTRDAEIQKKLEIEKLRKKWRDCKRKQKESQTEEQRELIRKKRRENYQKSKAKFSKRK